MEAAINGEQEVLMECINGRVEASCTRDSAEHPILIAHVFIMQAPLLCVLQVAMVLRHVSPQIEPAERPHCTDCV